MESNNRNDMPAFMDTDLDPYTLVHDIVSNWWVIILGAIAGALLTYVVVSSRYVPEYTTQATFVVSSRGDANAYSNLSSANTMAKTFEKILKSNIMEKKICEKLKVEELDADIHAKVLEGTNPGLKCDGGYTEGVHRHYPYGHGQLQQRIAVYRGQCGYGCAGGAEDSVYTG